MNKKIFLIFMLLLFVNFVSADTNNDSEFCVYVFVREGCSQCDSVKPFLNEMKELYDVNIKIYDVSILENQELYEDFKKTHGIAVGGYPIVFMGDSYLLGVGPIESQFESKLSSCIEYGCVCPSKNIRALTSKYPSESELTHEDRKVVNLFGKDLDVGQMPLVLSTFIISFIDGFNPCSLWIITFLLGIVIMTGSRKKIFAVGFTYLVVAGIVYGAFIIGLLSVFSYLGYLFWIRFLVAIIALIFALVNIKDFFWYKKGISFTIPNSYKPKIFKKIRNLMKLENNLKTLILGSAIMALGITLVELPCTAGFPMLWSNIVASQNVDFSFFVVLFLIYMFTYFLIELVIFLFAVFTLRASKFEEKHGRLLKLIGGVIMLSLASVLLIDPNMLNNIGGTLIIFGASILLSILIYVVSEVKNKKNKEEQKK